MRCRALWGLIAVASLGTYSAVAVYAKKTSDTANYFKQIPKTERIPHALDRLTFGARPGDAAQVQKTGLKKWVEQQLHPERIKENPLVAEKLKPFDTLTMTTDELVRDYPTPQMVKQMLQGTVPYPTDPDRRMMIQKLAAREAKRVAAGGQGVEAIPPDPQKALADLLTAEEVRSLRTGTPRQRFDAFMALPSDKQDDVVAVAPAGVRQALFVAAPPDVRRRLELAAGPLQVVARDLMEAKILRAVYSNRQLEEVLADFWFNHFNVYFDKGADRYLLTEYERDAIRPHVLGKFRDLLEATAKSPAMLFYLDNWQSVGANPRAPQRPNIQRRGLNENYGRELMELHTLGVDGGYTQKDVTEVARCFTGWTINQPQRQGTFQFVPRLHDTGEKVVLGVKIPAGGGIEDGEKVLDILARHPSTAHFISKGLAQRFVADDPPQSLVDRMAQTFLKTDGDLRAVMETMFNSKEFWSEGAYRTKIKSPLEMVVSAVRAANGNVDFATSLVNQIAQLGEPLYRKQEPTGYSNVSKAWLNSAGLMARMNFAMQLSANKMPGVELPKPDEAEGLQLGAPAFQKR